VTKNAKISIPLRLPELGNTVRPSTAAEAAPSDRTPFHESAERGNSSRQPRPPSSIQHVESDWPQATVTIQGYGPLRRARSLPVLAWPRFEFQGRTRLPPVTPVGGATHLLRAPAHSLSPQVKSGQVRTCFLSLGVNHQLGPLDLGPRPQVNMAMYPKHIILATLGHIYQSYRV
jgi:hypothetical protein